MTVRLAVREQTVQQVTSDGCAVPTHCLFLSPSLPGTDRRVGCVLPVTDTTVPPLHSRERRGPDLEGSCSRPHGCRALF